MKPRDLARLLNRGAAAIETPDDLTEQELREVAEDLVLAAAEFYARGEAGKVDAIENLYAVDALLEAALWEARGKLSTELLERFETRMGETRYLLEVEAHALGQPFPKPAAA